MTAATALIDFPFSLQQYANRTRNMLYTILTGYNVTRHVLPKQTWTYTYVVIFL